MARGKRGGSRLLGLAETAGVRWIGPRLAAGRPANVAMFHVGRSGSVALARQLAAHPRIHWDGEIYEPGRRLLGRRGDPMRLLERRMLRAGRRIFGFEAKFFHAQLVGLEFDDFFGRVADRDFAHFIVLRRRNTLRKLVSSLVLHETGRGHLPAGETPVLHRIRIDVESVRIDRDCKPLVGFLRDYEAGFERLERLLAGREVLGLSYEEDLADDPRRGYRRVCEFLGVPATAAPVDVAKTNPFPLEEIVTNLEEVAAALRGTGFEWMLED